MSQSTLRTSPFRMQLIPPHLGRSWLLVAADRLGAYEGSSLDAADAVIVDLEDAVAEARKGEGRSQAVAWLQRSPSWVRVNDAGSRHWQADLEAIRDAPGLLGVMLAKTESASQVAATAAVLRTGAWVIPLIESAAGLEAASEIAAEPATFRLAFGSGDFRRDTGMADDPIALAYPRSRLVVASAAAGKAGPIDGPAVGASGAEATDAARHARTMGMTGKLLLDPTQAPAINEGLSPSESELEHALALLDNHEPDAAVDGSYAPQLARAEALVSLAVAFGQAG